jgi:hypothetical protein
VLVGIPFVPFAIDGFALIAVSRCALAMHANFIGKSRNSEEFRHPSTCRSEQLARTSALAAARRSETELLESIVACA